MQKHPITPDCFDGMVSKPEKVWGAPAIARLLGVSVDTVYRLSDDEDCPIYRPSGRYFAFRGELMAWLRTKRAA